MGPASVGGARVGTAAAGIKKGGAPDVAVIAFDAPSPTACVFTTNRFAAAPVDVAREHLARCGRKTSAWVVNSGNANCGNGAAGTRDARKSCAALAARIGAKAESVLPFSTGVIMEPMPMDKVASGIGGAAARLGEDGWDEAAAAIMTTDTVPKIVRTTTRVRGAQATIMGIAKGSGMIHPDMATMLAFIVTDAGLPAARLSRGLADAVPGTFNSITVDGDTSTNDAVALAATGAAGAVAGADAGKVLDAVGEVCSDLASQIVADGEGATCTATVTVTGLAGSAACKRVAVSIADSPLIKTMLHARDPNIGRLLMAIGKSGVAFDPKAVRISVNGNLAFRSGARAPSFTEARAQRCFDKPPLAIDVAMGKGRGRASVEFCDLSADYVRINAEYRT